MVTDSQLAQIMPNLPADKRTLYLPFLNRAMDTYGITGRANYEKFGELLGVDLVDNPEIAATPQIAFSTAGAFWQTNGLNELADEGDFEEITRRINGGLSGYDERLAYYEHAQNVLERRLRL
ncbi:MAG: hypothetical protein J2P41_02635 [Blastocatellia bacterium]|nr:hypothetical protein [Blastocatellia bacterium]